MKPQWTHIVLLTALFLNTAHAQTAKEPNGGGNMPSVDHSETVTLPEGALDWTVEEKGLIRQLAESGLQFCKTSVADENSAKSAANCFLSLILAFANSVDSHHDGDQLEQYQIVASYFMHESLSIERIDSFSKRYQQYLALFERNSTPSN